MKFSCDQCSAQYMIADEKVGTRGVKVKCKKCEHIIVVKPSAVGGGEETPAPSESPPSSQEGEERRDTSVETGGAFNAMFSNSPFDEPTQAMSAEQLAGLKAAAAEQGTDAAASTDPFASGQAPSFGAETAASGDATGDNFGAPAADSFGAPAADSFGAPAADSFGAPASDNFGAPASDSFGAPAADSFGAPAADSFGAPAADSFGAPVGDTSVDAAWGGVEAQAEAPLAPSGRDPGEKEWYVAIDDSQVGPVDIAEIEQRWDKRELDEDSLAWKAGMADWAPIAEVAELAYLVTERPQQKSTGAAAGASFGATTAAAAISSTGDSASRAGFGPVAFSGSNDEAAQDVSWTPSAASALSSLVQDELEAPAQQATAPAESGSLPQDLGMPSFGAGDLFGGGGGQPAAASPAPAAVPAFNAPAADPFGGATASWTAPKPKSGGGHKLIILFGLVGVVVVAAAAVVVVVLLRQPQILQPGAQPGAPAPGPAVAQQGTGTATAPAKGQENAGRSATQVPAPTPKTEPRKTSRSSGSSKPRERKASGSSSSSRDKGKTKKGKSSGGADDIFDAPKRSSRVLGKSDIVNGFKKNAGNLKPCIKSAMQSGELARGAHKLILAWVIQPDGGVAQGQLTGPSSVMGTSLRGCFAKAMRRWKWPASAKPTPVKGYPLAFSF